VHCRQSAIHEKFVKTNSTRLMLVLIRGLRKTSVQVFNITFSFSIVIFGRKDYGYYGVDRLLFNYCLLLQAMVQWRSKRVPWGPKAPGGTFSHSGGGLC